MTSKRDLACQALPANYPCRGLPGTCAHTRRHHQLAPAGASSPASCQLSSAQYGGGRRESRAESGYSGRNLGLPHFPCTPAGMFWMLWRLSPGMEKEGYGGLWKARRRKPSHRHPHRMAVGQILAWCSPELSQPPGEGVIQTLFCSSPGLSPKLSL